MSRLIHRKIKVQPLINPGTAARSTASTPNNTAVDTQGFEEMILLVNTGQVDAVNLNITMQHSDEAAANFAAIPMAAFDAAKTINPKLLTLVNADDNVSIVAYYDLSALKRYVKPVDGLNANYAVFDMTALLFGPDNSDRTKDSVQPYEPDAAVS
jgi:hypothetical protein